MAQQVSYTCDVCGVEKQEANHWYMVLKTSAGGLLVYPWAKGMHNLSDTSAKHVCGQAHVHTLLDKYFSELS